MVLPRSEASKSEGETPLMTFGSSAITVLLIFLPMQLSLMDLRAAYTSGNSGVAVDATVMRTKKRAFFERDRVAAALTKPRLVVSELRQMVRQIYGTECVRFQRTVRNLGSRNPTLKLEQPTMSGQRE
ncbi:hypothetical protein F0562_001899 [Nyssa sinensis]|uniref:Uncharacterized protein n=1 Tax=Nyssa sinensis TaxID=561372 RepID=A0A5J5C4G9_9ASTE|nr:hypothetical protein F0562_001899 [Nyssa sinensis]